MSSVDRSLSSYKNKKNVDEVKEVIQNKPIYEIVKVLEVFDNDVGKTIDAFVTDGGKSALNKWAENNRKRPTSNSKGPSSAETRNVLKSEITSTITNEVTKASDDAQSKSNNNNNNKKAPTSAAPSSQNKNKINDLVASVINQFTSSHSASTLADSAATKSPATAAKTDAYLAGTNTKTALATSKNQEKLEVSNKPFVDISNLKNKLLSSQTLFGGVKIKVLEIETNSVSTSGSTSSSTSNNGDISNNNTDTGIDTDTDVDTIVQSRSFVNSNVRILSTTPIIPPPQPPSSSVAVVEKSIPSATNIISITPTPREAVQHKVDTTNMNLFFNNKTPIFALEKQQTALVKQANQINNIAFLLEEERHKSHYLIIQTFNQIRQLLNERQVQIENQLTSAAKLGSELLARRQNVAVELKKRLDDSSAASNESIDTLKSDIEHFVSESHLDEEIGSFKFASFQQDVEELKHKIQSLGSVAQIADKFAKYTYNARVETKSAVPPVAVSVAKQPEPIAKPTPAKIEPIRKPLVIEKGPPRPILPPPKPVNESSKATTSRASANRAQPAPKNNAPREVTNKASTQLNGQTATNNSVAQTSTQSSPITKPVQTLTPAPAPIPTPAPASTAPPARGNRVLIRDYTSRTPSLSTESSTTNKVNNGPRENGNRPAPVVRENGIKTPAAAVEDKQAPKPVELPANAGNMSAPVNRQENTRSQAGESSAAKSPLPQRVARDTRPASAMSEPKMSLSQKIASLIENKINAPSQNGSVVNNSVKEIKQETLSNGNALSSPKVEPADVKKPQRTRNQKIPQENGHVTNGSDGKH